MKLQEVVSSNISGVGYEKEGNLIVGYTSGATYRYKGVPKELYEALLKAESKGRFMNESIKGHYEYERVDKN